jgi:Icc-related predicted phosphoesterase
MSSTRVTRVLCAADPGGSEAAVEQLVRALDDGDADAVALVGDLGAGDPHGYRTLFRALGATQRHAFWVPGPRDAPLEGYLHEAANIEVVHPFLHGVHGTAALAPGHVLFAGLGGEVVDDPATSREELDALRYPGWEAEYRLKIVREFDEHPLVALFATPPAHKGHGTPGSEVVAELIATHRARLAVCGGPRLSETIGRTLVVAPGSLREGHYAVADMHERSVEMRELAPVN